MPIVSVSNTLSVWAASAVSATLVIKLLPRNKYSITNIVQIRALGLVIGVLHDRQQNRTVYGGRFFVAAAAVLTVFISVVEAVVAIVVDVCYVIYIFLFLFCGNSFRWLLLFWAIARDGLFSNLIVEPSFALFTFVIVGKVQTVSSIE